MIRKSENRDIDVILKIWLSASIKAHNFIESYFWESQVEQMRKVYLPASEIFVYDQNNLITGFYALFDNKLAALFVKPEFQGKGIGKELLKHAKNQRDFLILTVYKANESSCRFYLNNGFKIKKEQIDVNTGHTELVMSTES